MISYHIVRLLRLLLQEAKKHYMTTLAHPRQDLLVSSHLLDISFQHLDHSVNLAQCSARQLISKGQAQLPAQDLSYENHFLQQQSHHAHPDEHILGVEAVPRLHNMWERGDENAGANEEEKEVHGP